MCAAVRIYVCMHLCMHVCMYACVIMLHVCTYPRTHAYVRILWQSVSIIYWYIVVRSSTCTYMFAISEHEPLLQAKSSKDLGQ